MPQLVAPTVQLADSFRAAMADFAAEGRGGPDDDSALGSAIAEFGGRWHTEQGIAEFIERLHAAADPATPVPPGWTHVTSYWWAEGDQFLGSIELVPAVLDSAGLIGYDVAPGCAVAATPAQCCGRRCRSWPAWVSTAR